MSTFTPEHTRVVVDDLDAVFRQAVVAKTLKEVFATEKHRLVNIQ